jgi:acyl transferase domain-containing protein
MSGSLDRPLLDLLFDEEQAGLLDQTIYTQPALFAMEYALTELWRSFGVRADAVIGHSVGAYAAACAAGVFALETAAEAVIARGRLMARIDEPGAMYAAFASGRRWPRRCPGWRTGWPSRLSTPLTP